MKKILILSLTTLFMFSLVACGGEKEYPYILSKNKTVKFIEEFSANIESDDDNFELNPGDIDVYQISKDEQAAVLKAKDNSEEFVVILDRDYNIIENVFVNSQEDKMLILSSEGISNISIPKYSFEYDGNIDEKFKQGLIETATGEMLDALNNATSIKIETVDQKIKLGTKAGGTCVTEAVYYYEITAIDDQDNSLVGLFHSSTKNYSKTTQNIYIYYDGLKQYN